MCVCVCLEVPYSVHILYFHSFFTSLAPSLSSSLSLILLPEQKQRNAHQGYHKSFCEIDTGILAEELKSVSRTLSGNSRTLKCLSKSVFGLRRLYSVAKSGINFDLGLLRENSMFNIFML